MDTNIVERRVVRRVDWFARRVSRRLAQLGMNMDDLAEKLGVSRPRVSAVLLRGDVTVDMFERISDALGVAPDWWDEPVARVVRDSVASKQIEKNAISLVNELIGSGKRR